MEDFSGPAVAASGGEDLGSVNIEGVRRVMLGGSSYWSSYFINPSLRIDDLWFSLAMCGALLLLRMVLCGAMHPRLKNVPNLCKTFLRRFSKENKRDKFAENLWYTIWHTISFCWCMYILYEDWTSAEDSWIRLIVLKGQTRWLWAPTGTEKRMFAFGNFPLMPPSERMRCFYLTEFAFWLSCLLFICFETIRHDFHVLVVHHVATCFLIAFSYLCCYWRIGAIILPIHDIVDIFLYAAKSLHYSRVSNRGVDGVFMAFVVVFFVSRLVVYPLYCVWPVLDIWTIRQVTGGVVRYHWDVPGGVLLPTFLCILQVLHLFWFGLILKMVFKTVKQKALHVEKDIRSDDEDEPAPKASNKNE